MPIEPALYVGDMAFALTVMLVAMLSIQMGAGFAKSLFPVAGPAGTTSLRLLFATLILWVIWRPWRFRLRRADLKILLFYGAALGLMNLTFYLSLQRIPLGLAVTLEFLGPLALSMLASRKRLDFVWALLAAAGVYLIMPHVDPNHALDPLGVAYALVAGGFWALYIFFGQRVGSRLHGGMATSLGMAIATVVALPLTLAIDGVSWVSWSLVPLGFLVATMSSAIPYSLEMVALKRMPAKTFSILMSLEPAIASLVGLGLLREVLSRSQWLAIGLVMIASLGTVVSARQKKVSLEMAP